MKATITFTDKPDGQVDVVLEFSPGAFQESSEAHKFAAKAIFRLQEFKTGDATLFLENGSTEKWT